jgi:hypothetical protein
MAEVKGTGIMEQQAREGLKLFEPEAGPAELDVAGAEAHKAKIDAQIAALDAQVAQLTGKDNKKERTAKSKEISDLKLDPQYIDACKVVKGLEPKNGHFVKSAPAAIKKAPAGGGYSGSAPPVAPPPAPEKKDEKKDDKKAKKQESAGLSPAEKKELEKLKTDIVARKTQLKNEGLSGGQQNKDQQVVEMVKRMNELKEKEEPGSTAPAKKETKKSSKAPLSSEEQKELDKLRGEIETYKHKLKTEFGYSAKDMKIDEDLQEMEKRIAELEKRS